MHTDDPQPMRLARQLHLCLVLGFLIGLAPIVMVAQNMPAPSERVRKDHEQEIQQVLGHLHEEDRSVDSMLYVIMPLIGLVGGVLLLRLMIQI